MERFGVTSGKIRPDPQPAGTAGIVIIFVILLLLKREDLRDQFIYPMRSCGTAVSAFEIYSLSWTVGRGARSDYIVLGGV